MKTLIIDKFGKLTDLTGWRAWIKKMRDFAIRL